MKLPFPFAILTRLEIDPTMTEAYQLAVSKIKAATEKAGNFPPVLYSLTVHGTTPTYISARPFSKFAERDDGPSVPQAVEKMFGANESRSVFETINRATRRRESSVIAFREDLSWARKVTTTNQ